MRIFVGSDHAGFDQKQHLVSHLRNAGYDVCDVGTSSADDSVDYPDFAIAVAHGVAEGKGDFGVLVCGTGIGMAMAANKVAGVRAASITSPEFAKLARQHNDANVVAVSGRFVPEKTNEAIVDTFLGTPFEGGRHSRRIEKMAAEEN